MVGIEDSVVRDHEEQQSDKLQRQRALNAKLAEWIQEPEACVQCLEAHIHQLKQELITYSPHSLRAQMGALTIPSHSTSHGPDTVGHFDVFSVDIIAEFRQHCPNILALLQLLGNSSVDDDPSKQAKIITCLSILMKGYSRKVLGVQLMTSFMLLARATSKQVCVHVHVPTCIIFVQRQAY